MNYDDKKFLSLMKAIFYQLFSRKMQYVIFSGDPNNADTLMFTNVSNEVMLVYDDSPEYCFHKVMIKDKEFLEDFYSRFPQFRNNPAIIRVVDFLSPMSKLKELSDVKLSITDSIINILTPGVDPVTKESIVESKEIGNAFSTLERDMYYSVYNSGLVVTDDPFKLTLSLDDYVDNEPKVIVAQDISHPSEQRKAQYALAILQPGFNIPTLHAFCKSVKDTSVVTVVSGYDKNCLVLNYEYDSDLLTSHGVQPAQRWFAKNTTV